MPGLTRCNARLLQAAEKAVIFFMGVIALVIPYEVFGRYVLGDVPVGSGEMATYSLVWVSMLGGAVGLRKGFQVGVLFVVEKLPPAIARLVRLAGGVVMLAFFTAMVYFGVQQTVVNLQQISPALGLSMAAPYAALPVGFALMWLFTAEQIGASIRRARQE